ncbi:hypothetical protein CIK05_11175 [Bdellovibrio sp. qaytius]|nr:hypothetical protein CIK05_11175 [Bdellovibrio sp. qaytius]
MILDLSFLTKATGIVFRESFEAVLIYGIIVSYFKKHESNHAGLRSAKTGLILGILASVVLGIALAGAIPAFSPEIFSYFEIFIVLGGSLMMLYMVFWMSEHSKHLKHDIETGIKQDSSNSIVGAVFVAIFREGIEAVVYLYSLAFEKPTLAHQSSVLLSLTLGVLLAVIVYQLMLKGSKHLSLKTIFRISGIWLLISSSSLIATGLDKVYSAGFLENFSEPLFSIDIPEFFARAMTTIESMVGIRTQPTIAHLALFILFWSFVIYKDPLKFRHKEQVAK